MDANSARMSQFNQNAKQRHLFSAKRGKKRASNSGLVLNLLLIGWESGASFANRKANANYVRHAVENSSIDNDTKTNRVWISMHDSIYGLYPHHIPEQKSPAHINLIVEIIRSCEKLRCYVLSLVSKSKMISFQSVTILLGKRKSELSKQESKLRSSDYMFYWLLKVTLNNVMLLL